jgi:hypothetical protein
MYVVLLLFLGTTGIVDYTNYEDMKYAVSYLLFSVDRMNDPGTSQ